VDWVDGDPPAGADHLASAGWTLAHSVLMRLTRADDRTGSSSTAQTLHFELLRDAIVQVWLDELPPRQQSTSGPARRPPNGHLGGLRLHLARGQHRRRTRVVVQPADA